MRIPMRHNVTTLLGSLLSASLLLASEPASAQAAPSVGPIQEAGRLDTQGATKEARALFQSVIDTAAMPAARAAARRAMALSYGFDGDCANTVKYEEMVIAYWKTREQAEPQNAFYPGRSVHARAAGHDV